jgi:hypothetical protein
MNIQGYFKLIGIGLIAAIIISTTGCGISEAEYTAVSKNLEDIKLENEQIKKENADFKDRITSLEKELDEIKFGAERLYKQAETSFNDKAYIKAKDTINDLLFKHPDSSEANKAKELLENIETIEKQEKEARELAEKQKIEVEKKKLAEATKKMRKQYDEVQDVTWYYDKTTPSYADVNNFHLYIGKKGNGIPWLRLNIQYSDEDWLFINQYVIKVDDQAYEITPKYGEVESDHGGGDIWEWYDTPVNNHTYKIIKAIISSNKTIIRSHGDQYYDDRVISDKEKTALQNVLDAYKALGGSFSF